MRHLVALVPTRGQVASLRTAFVAFSFLRWAALPVSDRRWTAPLSAIAVGFGLFIGVGMSPGLDPSHGGAIVQVPETVASSDAGGAPPLSTATAVPELGSPAGGVAAPPGPGSSIAPSAPAPPATPVTPVAPPPTTPEPPPTATTEESPTAPPAEETEQPLVIKGTVIHVNPEADSYGLTTGKGQLSAIHAKKLPEVGRKLQVEARELANGTFAEDGKAELLGRASGAKFQGLVTYVDPTTGDYTISRRGTSIFVRLDPANVAEPPAVGNLLTVEVSIAELELAVGAPPEPVQPAPVEPVPEPAPADPPARPAPPQIEVPAIAPPALPDGCGPRPPTPQPPETTLVERSRETGADFLGYSDFEGIVQGVCRNRGTLILSGDDIGESGADLTFAVPADAEIDLATIASGDVVDASATIDEPTLELTLTGVSGDGGVDEADDPALAQGDQAG